jgi:hypothetical protein
MGLLTYYCGCEQLWVSISMFLVYPLLFVTGVFFAKWFYNPRQRYVNLINNDKFGLTQIKLSFNDKLNIFRKLLKSQYISKGYPIDELLEDNF